MILISPLIRIEPEVIFLIDEDFLKFTKRALCEKETAS